MSDQSQQPVIDLLKTTMRRRSLRLTDVAERTGIPYRSLQNYFSRRTQMPVTAYLKICGVLGLDAEYVKKEKFDLYLPALKEALQEALGHLVPHYESDDQGVRSVDPRGMIRSSEDMRIDLDNLAMVVRSRYDIARERELGVSLSDDDDGLEVPQ